MPTPVDTIYEQAIKDPEGTIGTPLDLVEDMRFSLEEKRKILESWQADAIALQRAEGENMERDSDKREGASGLLEMINKAEMKVRH